MEQSLETQRTPWWFWLLSVLALLWEGLGCLIYVQTIQTDPATLTLDQRAIFEATPLWATGANAVAVWIGLIGAVMLLLRRRVAVLLLGISLAAVLIQASALILVPAISSMISSDALLLPAIVVLICYGVFQLSLLARKKGWLR